MPECVGGIISFKVDGVQYNAKGDFTYLVNPVKREAVVGSDGVHGYKETPQVCYIEGEITDSINLDLSALCGITDATVQLDLANGKSIVLREAWYASEGEASTGEGNIKIRFEGKSGEEMK